MTDEKGGARVTIRTAQFLIEGRIHTAGREPGYNRRVSDVLNDQPHFLVLKDVDFREIAPGKEAKEPTHYETFILRKAEVIFALPLD